MSDLGAIFHVKKSGTQYDAHAYTTTDECPEPNLKVNFKGTVAYIKLETKDSGDVPCYVKKRDGGVYQVRTVAVAPTGQLSISLNTDTPLVIPSQIKVLHVVSTANADGTGSSISHEYIGVTPGTSHTFLLREGGSGFNKKHNLTCKTHSGLNISFQLLTVVKHPYLFIKWSPEINEQTPTISHYD